MPETRLGLEPRLSPLVGQEPRGLSIRIQPKETFFLLKSKSLFTTPTKGAVNCGQGMTIFAKRPTPSALGKKTSVCLRRGIPNQPECGSARPPLPRDLPRLLPCLLT